MEYIQQISWALELQFWESIAIQETEEVNLTPESQQQSRRNIQINRVLKSTESEFVLAQREASPWHVESDSKLNYGQTKRFLTMYLRIFPYYI